METIFDPFVDVETKVELLSGDVNVRWNSVQRCIANIRESDDTDSVNLLLTIMRRIPLEATWGFHIWASLAGIRSDIAEEIQRVQSTKGGGMHALCHCIWEYIEDRMSVEELRSGIEVAVSDLSDDIVASVENDFGPTVMSSVVYLLKWFFYAPDRDDLAHIPLARANVIRQIIPYFILKKYVEIGPKSLDSYFFEELRWCIEVSMEILHLLVRWCDSLTPDDCSRVIDMIDNITWRSDDRSLFVREFVECYAVHRPITTTLSMRRFVSNDQNVHHVRIEPDTLVELDTLDAKFKEREDDSLRSFREKPELREALDRIETDPSDFHGRTLKEWLRIVFLWAKDEGHLDILEQELQDMTGKCSSGHFRRLINVPNGFLYHLEESVARNNERELFFKEVDALIKAQPDCDEIVCDISTRGVKYVNDVAVENMLHGGIWKRILEWRRIYLYGE